MSFLEEVKVQFANYYNELIVAFPKILTAIFVVIIFFGISRYLRKRVIAHFKQRADDKLLVNFINGVFKVLNILLSLLIFLVAIGKAGIAGSILGAATFSSIVLGLAFKDIGENFLAGVIMAFNRPFRLGDIITSSGVEGIIMDMSIRETHIKTFDGKDVYIPNGQIIKTPLSNHTIDGFIRKGFDVGIEYGADLQQARSVILDAVRQVPGVINDEKPPFAMVQQFGDSAVTIGVKFWIDTFDKTHSLIDIQSDAMNRVQKALVDADIDIPYQTITIKN